MAYTLSPEVLQMLQANGLNASQIQQYLGISDPGTMGGLNRAFGDFLARGAGGDVQTGPDGQAMYNRQQLQAAAQYAGLDPSLPDDQLYQQLQGRDLSNVYSLTQDAAQGRDADWRSQQYYTLDGNTLNAAGDPTYRDQRADGGFTTFRDQALKPIATMAAIAATGGLLNGAYGAGAAGTAGESAGLLGTGGGAGGAGGSGLFDSALASGGSDWATGAATTNGSAAGGFAGAGLDGASGDVVDAVGSDWATGAPTTNGSPGIGTSVAAPQVASPASQPPASQTPVPNQSSIDPAKLFNTATGMPSWFGPAAAMAAGAAAGNSASGPQTSTSTQSLPAWMQPYAERYAQRAEALSNQPYQAYTGERVAPFNADQNTAFDMVRKQAGQAQPLDAASRQGLLDTIGGKYLDPNSNPYLSQTADAITTRMADAYKRGSAGTNAAFADAGSFGSSGHQNLVTEQNRAYGDALGSTLSNLYGQNYQQERGRQQQASLYAPQANSTMQATGYKNAEAMTNIGAQQQANQQARYDVGYQNYQDQRAFPYQQLQTNQSIFGNNFGSNQTSTQPGVSRAAGLLGGSAGALGLYRNYQGLLGGSTQQAQPYQANNQNPYMTGDYSNYNWSGNNADGSYFYGY